jgi:hypothetical protein
MIDFRYHLVSLVAVFLALSLGLLLGSTVLRPYVQKTLQAASKTEKRQIDTLLGEKQQLQAQFASANQFAQANAAVLLRQRLADQRVVLVLAPGAPDSVTSGITQVLGTAGATVTGQIQLQPAFYDTSAAASQKLTQFAEELAPAGLPLAGSAQAQASELIARVVMTTNGVGQPVPGQRDATSVAALQGLAGGGFLSVSGQPWDRATLAVVIISATPQSADDSSPANRALVTLAQQLNLAGQGTVVAGSVTGSGPGSAIDLMRAGGQSGHLSSVDDADYPIGQIVVAQALYEQLSGKSGSYGVTANASAPGPSPAPSATPTGAATPGTASTGRSRPVPTATGSATR